MIPHLRIFMVALVAAFVLPASGQVLPNDWTAHSACAGVPGTARVVPPDVFVTENIITLVAYGTQVCNEWLWAMVACHEGYGCSIDTTIANEPWLIVFIKGNLNGSGMGRVVIQLGLDDGGVTPNWYELDINLVTTPAWPRPDARWDYFAVAPLHTYDLDGGPHYYAVLDGRHLFQIVNPDEWTLLSIPVARYVRKVCDENPELFPVPAAGWTGFHLSSYGVAVETRGDEVAAVSVEVMSLFNRIRPPMKHLDQFIPLKTIPVIRGDPY